MTEQVSTPTSAAQEWAQYWPIVLASFIGIGLCLSPLPYYATITIAPELENVFGWDRITTTSAFIFMTAGVLVGAPLAGRLADRFGARKVLLPSIILLGLGTAALGLTNSKPLVFYTIFYFTAVFGSGTLPLTWSKAIVNNFDKSRGLALGFALTGTGVYGFLAPPFIRMLIDGVDWSTLQYWFTTVPLAIWLSIAAFYYFIMDDRRKTGFVIITALITYLVLAPILFSILASTGGWRSSYFAIGVLPILYSLPLAIALFSDKREEAALVSPKEGKTGLSFWLIPVAAIIGVWALIVLSLQSVGVMWAAAIMLVILLGFIAFETIREKPEDLPDLPGLSLKETVRDYRFWVIFVAFLILGACVSGIIINTINILFDKGYSPQMASSPIMGLGLIGFSVIIGRIIGGIVVDYVWAPLVAFLFMGVPAIGCWIFMQDLPMIYNSIAIVLVGVAAGVEFDLMAYLVSRYLGMKSYGRVYSFIYAAFGIGSGTAGAIFNAIRGDAANYNSVLMFALVGFLFGATILLSLGKYRDFGDPHASGH